VSSSAAHLALIGRHLVCSAACRKRPHCGQFTAGSMVLSICVQTVVSWVRVRVSPSRKACKRRFLGTHVAGRQLGPDAPGGLFGPFQRRRTSNVGAAMHVGRPFPYDQQGEAGPLPVLVHGDMDGSDRSLRRCFSRRARCRGGRPRGFLPPVAPRRARRPASASVGPRGSNACHARTRGRRRALAEHPATRPG
jgi:hypothetical protein